MRRLLSLLTCLLISSIGCSGNPGKNPEPIDVTGTVTLNGAPVTDVVLNLQPTVPGAHPAVANVTDGKFKTLAAPGTYCYFITAGKSPAAYKKIPAEYYTPTLESRDEIVVSSGASPIAITLE